MNVSSRKTTQASPPAGGPRAGKYMHLVEASIRHHHNPVNRSEHLRRARPNIEHQRPLQNRPSTDFENARVGDTIGEFSFDPNEAERFKNLDIAQIRKEFAKNLEGFKGEVLDDMPVSHRYHYYYDRDGNVFNHPDRQAIHRFETQFDPRERDGLPQEGFKKAADIMFINPHATVLWYSPPGEASSDKRPSNPYADVNFIYGQLYVMNYDGEKINGVAIKVDREGESAIEQFMPDQFLNAKEAVTDYERIAYFLKNPATIRGGIGDIVANAWNEGTVYSGKEDGVAKQKFTVSQMMRLLEQRFGDEDAQTGEFDELVKRLTRTQLTSKREIAKIYLKMILGHSNMQENGQISLKGACGGSNVTVSRIQELLGDEQFIPPSTMYRVMTQGDYIRRLLAGEINDATDTHYESYRCQHCNKKMSGESRDGKNWRKACDGCGVPLGC